MVQEQGARADWRRWLAEPEPAAHSVQFYKDPAFLIEAVAHFITAGIARREATVLVMTASHRQLLCSRLREHGWEASELSKCAGMRVLDAEETLAVFMRDGRPDEHLFFECITRTLREARLGFSQRVRAFGEMVDVLWRQGNQAAALELEELWNRVIARESLVLHCAYDADVFESATHSGGMCGVHHAHTHVMAVPDPHVLDFAVDRAMSDVFGPLAGTLLRPSLAGESGSTSQLLRGLSAKLPAAAAAVLRRARTHYQCSRTYGASP
jgi:hypothetical protein